MAGAGRTRAAAVVGAFVVLLLGLAVLGPAASAGPTTTTTDSTETTETTETTVATTTPETTDPPPTTSSSTTTTTTTTTQPPNNSGGGGGGGDEEGSTGVARPVDRGAPRASGGDESPPAGAVSQSVAPQAPILSGLFGAGTSSGPTPRAVRPPARRVAEPARRIQVLGVTIEQPAEPPALAPTLPEVPTTTAVTEPEDTVAAPLREMTLRLAGTEVAAAVTPTERAVQTASRVVVGLLCVVIVLCVGVAVREIIRQ